MGCIFLAHMTQKGEASANQKAWLTLAITAMLNFHMEPN
jgi:hypothetical protein